MGHGPGIIIGHCVLHPVEKIAFRNGLMPLPRRQTVLSIQPGEERAAVSPL
jgi:hypothetical protein